jgi:hypothetical protein
MNANVVRMIASAGCRPTAIYWFLIGFAGFFAVVAAL